MGSPVKSGGKMKQAAGRGISLEPEKHRGETAGMGCERR